MNLQVYGLESLGRELDLPDYFLKCLINHKEIVFFPEGIQHRDVKIGGLSYEDNYAGNSLAAILTPERFEIRFHSQYSDSAVAEIIQRIRTTPETSWLASHEFSYQGRRIA